MVLRYMVSDTELSTGEAVRPETKRTLAVASRARLCLLLTAAVVVWAYAYHCWRPIKGFPAWKSSPSKRPVTGIIYNPEKPAAILFGRIVHEGDVIDGYEVIRIHRDEVELAKDGNQIVERVYKQRSENEPGSQR